MKKNRNIPFGYCMINGKYAVNTVESAAVKQIFTEYSDGKSLNEIAAKMTVPYHSDKERHYGQDRRGTSRGGQTVS